MSELDISTTEAQKKVFLFHYPSFWIGFFSAIFILLLISLVLYAFIGK